VAVLARADVVLGIGLDVAGGALAVVRVLVARDVGHPVDVLQARGRGLAEHGGGLVTGAARAVVGVGHGVGVVVVARDALAVGRAAVGFDPELA